MSQTVVMDICRMSMKLCKEVLYGITLAIEQLVLQNSARLIQHTASASVASTLSTGAATFGNLFSMVFKPVLLATSFNGPVTSIGCVCSVTYKQLGLPTTANSNQMSGYTYSSMIVNGWFPW